MQRGLQLVVFSLFGLWAGPLWCQTATTSATQAVLSYTATNTNNCTIEVSTSAGYSPVVYAVDTTKFTNANLDGHTNANSRQFVVGQKWIAQENVSPPVATVTAGNAVRALTVVTITFASQPFVVGDNITIAGIPGDATLVDAWARVESASANSFTYTTIPSGTFTNTGSLTITRANRYSLALAANTTYFYRIGNGAPTCVASPLTGSFTTMNIPNGNTWAEGPVRDNNGLQIEPSISESRTATIIDPLTGSLVRRLSIVSDWPGLVHGWDSAYFRVCSYTLSANGYYHCAVGAGSSDSGALYSVCPIGQSCTAATTHFLGAMLGNYTDSNGFHCCNSSIPYFNGVHAWTDSTNNNIFYHIMATNSANWPYKLVMTSNTFTGNDAADVASGSNWSVAAAVALTPDPSNTLTDKLVAFDAAFVPVKFSGCSIASVEGDYIIGTCFSGTQGSPDWMYVFKISTASIVAAGSMFRNGQTRWGGSHGGNQIGSQKWQAEVSSDGTGSGVGEWHVHLSGAITTDTSFGVIGGYVWRSATLYQFYNGGDGSGQGASIIDSNGNVEVTSTQQGGISGSMQPTWNVTVGGTTTDNTITWINAGPVDHPGEPQNILPFLGGDGKYWTYLQDAAGANAGGAGGLSGGQYNGDLFLFEDGTGECVRLATKGTTSGGIATWASVTRAVHNTNLAACTASSPQNHAAGAELMAICEQSFEVNLAWTVRYWDFVDDPHLADITNTYWVQQHTLASHGYSREIAPHGGIWATYNIFNTHNPFITSDFTSNTATFALSTGLTFNNKFTDSAGVTHQDYTNWDFQNAAFKDSALNVDFFVSGGGIFGSFAKVGGTSTIYQYTFNNTYFTFHPDLPYVPTSGGQTIKDISGPGSLLVDNGATPLVCVVTFAGECWAGSTSGQAYANLPVVDAGSANRCNNGGSNLSYGGHDWCLMNTASYGNAITQAGLIPSNRVGTQANGTPLYGFGLSRRLFQNAVGGWRLQSPSPHAILDGSGVLFFSCFADPHISIDFFNSRNSNCQVYLGNIPTQPTADGVDRTTYLILPIAIGTTAGATYAVLKYGWEENEPIRTTAFPPTIDYYATQYRAPSYWGATGNPAYSTGTATRLNLNQTSNIQLGVPQRVLAYNILYFNGSDVQVGSSGLQWLSTDAVAIAGPGVSFNPTPVNFGSINVGSSSSPTTVNITNTGGATLHVNASGACPGAGVCITGTNPGDFSLSSDVCSGQNIAPNGTCAVAVTFSPTISGSRSANLVVTDSTDNVSGTDPLNGTGVGTAPAIGFNPTSVAFGSIIVGNSSSPHTVTVTNTGSANLILNAGAVTITGTNAGDFSFSADTCSNHTITPSNTCTVAVTFTPTLTGSRTANLTVTDVTDNVSGSDPLSGTGVSSGVSGVGIGIMPL